MALGVYQAGISVSHTRLYALMVLATPRGSRPAAPIA